MVTKEQKSVEAIVHSNASVGIDTGANTSIEKLQLQQQQFHHLQLPKASAAPRVIIIPENNPNSTTTTTNAAKKIRRGFSMPRNPFRWSRKFKTSTSTTNNASNTGGSNSALTSCVGGGRGRAGSIVSLSSYEAICKNTNGCSGNGDINGGDGICDGGGGGVVANEINTNDEKRDAVDKTVDQNKIVNGKTIGRGNENCSTASNSNRVLRRSSFRKFLNLIAQHVSTSINIGANKYAVSTAATADRVPPIGNYQWPADQTPGVMGLKNHGNTCFMNAVLQCLSHTDILAEYFVLDQYKADLKRRNKINSRKFGTKGELTEQLANVLKALWTCKNESDHSTSFKAVVDRYGSQFRSSTQHDAQEFLFWLLDKVHEDLNTATKRRYKSVKNSYGRPDEIIAAETLANHVRCNNSFVQAVFQAQFRSSLTCPRCKKQSNTFDPFHCISVQLPQLMQQTIFVIVVYLQRDPRQIKIAVSVPTGSPIIALRDQLQIDTGIEAKRMVIVDINTEGFTRVFYDTQPVTTLNGIETIYCIEVPEVKADTTAINSANAENNFTSDENSNSNNESNAEASIKNESDSNTTNINENVNIKNSATDAKSINVTSPTANNTTTELLVLVANMRKRKLADTENGDEEITANKDAQLYSVERFGMPFSLLTARDCSYVDLQKRLLSEMSSLLKPETLSSATTSLYDMFQIRLQDPSADPDTYLPNVEHPLLTEMIDLALSVLSPEAGPPHIKFLLEWSEPEKYFSDLSDKVVNDENVTHLVENSNSKPVSANDMSSELTLEQCLEHYTKAETLSAEDAWRCPHCQQYLPVVKTLGLWSLPDILVVHFKRFRQHHEKGANAAKLTTMVKFPLNAFDLSPHLARGCCDEDKEGPRTTLSAAAAAMEMAAQASRPSPWKKTRSNDSRSSTLSSRDNRETRYDLYAVCYHQGDTLETGHYTAACKNPYDRQWYKFDDQRVSKVPNESIEEEIINNEAYMLFYQRRNGDAIECSGSSSNSGDHWVSRIAPPPSQPSTSALIESISVSKQKLVEEDINEDRKEIVVVATAAAIEPIPGSIEEKSVDLTKTKDIINGQKDVVKEDKKIVIPNYEKISLDIETLDFADADSVPVDVIESTVIEEKSGVALMSKSKPELQKNSTNGGDNRIFVMDEDCQIDENPLPKIASPIVATTVLPAKSQLSPSLSAIKATITTTPTVATTITVPPTKTTSFAVTTTNTTVLTNGYSITNSTLPNRNSTNIDHHAIMNGKPKSPITTFIPISATSVGINGNDNACNRNGQRNRTSSNSSSSSSLSSHSSPHSLAASVHGASTLQSKFNGFTTNSVAASSNYKDVLLSSSLKSNSSSIISAAVAAHTAHEFHLTRHQPWHGSRSSVSALESGTTHTSSGGGGGHQHMHGLNLRHSFSTSSNCKLRECSETLSSMLRNSANTCSKDTLIFIDQQNHHHHHHHHHNHHSLIEDDDNDSFMGSRALWISPVTPHKLITVSPKN